MEGKTTAPALLSEITCAHNHTTPQGVFFLSLCLPFRQTAETTGAAPQPLIQSCIGRERTKNKGETSNLHLRCFL